MLWLQLLVITGCSLLALMVRYGRTVTSLHYSSIYSKYFLLFVRVTIKISEKNCFIPQMCVYIRKSSYSLFLLANVLLLQGKNHLL